VSLWSGAVHYYRDQRISGGGVTYHYTQLGNGAFHLFGYSVQSLDTGTVLVGAPGEKGGRVYRYLNGFNSAAGEGRANHKATYSQVDQGADEDGDLYGTAIAIGDFDGSDTLEFAIGAEGEAPGGDPNSGAVFVRRSLETGGWGRWSVHTQND
jgi:hypothetical protein